MNYYGDEQYGDEQELAGEVMDIEALTADIS
jgi:hypothetical protein